MNDHEDSEYDTARSGSSTDDDEFHSDELNEDERENGENEIGEDQEDVNEFSGNESSEEGEEIIESESSENDDDDDDDGGWVTPANIHSLRQTSGNCVEEKSVTVGCMSTDFAIQVRPP